MATSSTLGISNIISVRNTSFYTMNTEYIKARLIVLENYLNKNWQGLSDHFVERIIAISEYNKLIKNLKEKQNV